MKFIVDDALSPLIANGLREAGYEAIHVRDVGLQSASDLSIFQYAFKNEWILVSADADFGTLLAQTQHSRPSVILYKSTDKRPQSQLSLLLSNISRIRDALIAGSVIVFEDNRIRIRALPIN